MKMTTVYSNDATFDNGSIVRLAMDSKGRFIEYCKQLADTKAAAIAAAKAFESQYPRLFGNIAAGVTSSDNVLAEMFHDEVSGAATAILIDTTEVDVTDLYIHITGSHDLRNIKLDSFIAAGWRVSIDPINLDTKSPYKMLVTISNPVQPALMCDFVE